MTSTTAPPKSRRTVLVVDDEPANVTVLVSVLQSRYRVRAATSGARALVAATTERPDLVLLDVMMPDMDGYAVLEQLRGDARTRDIPVMFVTTLAGNDDEERGLRLGAVDYIAKPIRAAVVLARVHAHLALKDARDRLEERNASLEAEVRRRTRDSELSQDVSLAVIAGLVETRDAETGNHTLRTRAYVEVLARRLQPEPSSVEALALERVVKAAPLHDIGKIGIPDAILLKPGPLTPEEFEVMKTHARIGGEAIARAMRQATELGGVASGGSSEPFAFLETARQMALWHHERWDGEGYPDHLAGAEIPMCSRLMAIADVFDALTTKRVYKPPMPVGQALDIIRAGRGTQFDPAAVDAFLAAEDEVADIVQRYADVAS